MAAPAPAPAQPAFSLHPSRRPVIYATHGIVACTQPLAAQAGLNILRKGGNAADAAIAAAAVLNVTEPTSTGLGGDVFCLLHHAPTSTLHGINGSGPSPSSLTLQKVLASLPPNHTEWRIPAANPLSVTVPGAAAAWCDIVTRFGSGKVSLREIFDDAIRMAEDGFALSTFAGRWWGECAGVLRGSGREEMLLAGRAPREGEIMRVPELARVLREVAERGRAGFYEGWVAESVVGEVQALGGVLEMEDMAGMGERGSEDVDPVFVEYAGYKLWECAPNGQGLVALMTLGILKALQERGVVGKIGGEGGMQHNSPDYLHVLIECFRIAFTDGRWYITDPRTNPDPTAALLSKAYLHQRSTLFSPTQTNPTHPISPPSLYPCDTTYLSTTDAHGNSCSFTNSLQNGFGTGIVPRGTATPLQNRASSFSLDPDAPNCVAPGKRPYHTIIAGMVTERVPGAAEGEGGEKEGGNGGEGKGKGVKLNGERIKSVMGCMGGLMQPQGHVQLFMNLLVFNMDPQQALDAPRICLGLPGDRFAITKGVCLESGISAATAAALQALGHTTAEITGYERTTFGRGQIINYNYTHGEDGEERIVYSGGTDLRGDCQAVGY
ncbi:uncharacterized protein LAJ45_08070 [Morchella importuna]|uniref:uncharacterized protein n=1 Tax=Morchella importuna TaxID=1174673 RepID=UPI001E8DD041|nr:uncharacterized protein LAJ45_08070 [Morchella importuna]KAH8147969.1 hypothetical protein LAJ45_08070 [Morchella importuna]